MSNFQNKVVLITGGGTGIGQSIAERFKDLGAKVVVVGRREAPLKELADSAPDAIAYTLADVTKSEDLRAAVAFTVKRFGRLDVLVNNAGAFVAGPLVETSDEQIAQLLNVNVAGVLLASREALNELSKTKGSIVNVSSTVATGVIPGMVLYSATKAAVDQLTRVLAAEVGPAGVRVNTVSPGITQTDMAAPLLNDDATREGMVADTPLGRVGLPEDIARVATFLASDEAGWVTGQIVAASGGLLL
ncbi:MAG: SDR family oxidoreductase [Planctomycetes bacterium]|nr:SDR family oxidoreductase [Planctomycetota bacterium]